MTEPPSVPEAVPEPAAVEPAATAVAAPADPADPAAPTDAAAPATPAAPAELSPAACSARLAKLFPALFALQQPLPLKLRVQADIQQRAPGIFTKKTLSIFLHRYTTGTPYLVALAQHAQRHDLDGQPAGDVADVHRDAAAAELARRRALHAERREREQTAARERDAAAATQADARRDRAALLRGFETSTLTRANFLALKGLSDAALDATLQQARQERSERPERPDPDQRRSGQPMAQDRRGAVPDPQRRNAARGAQPERPTGSHPPRHPRPPRP